MTAAAASDKPAGRFVLLAHYPLPIGIVLALLDLGRAALHDVLVLRWGAVAVIAALFFTFTVAQMQHARRRLCNKCFSDAPLDPQATVAKRMRWLKLTHRLSETRLRWAPLGLLFAILALSMIKIGTFSLDWLGWTFWLVVLGPAVLLQIHNPLQPWCPFCRWGRGEGPKEPSPEPTPDPSEAPEKDVSV